MNNPLGLLLVGIGGYAQYHVKELLDKRNDNEFLIKGIIDPRPENCILFPELVRMGIPVYSSMEEFFENSKADLTLITTPINLHKSQVCYALSKGSNVLCEKPIAATVQDAIEMIEAKDKYGKILAIGFQWSFCDAIQGLKKDIMDGKFGKAKRLKTMVLWPRTRDYYQRPWAAKIKTVTGEWILDSVASNAAAHYLHNMLYVLGDEVNKSATPAEVSAELYRANNIENFDTVFSRVYTAGGTELFFVASHASKETVDPIFCYEFENAIIHFDSNEQTGILAKFKDGTVKNYGSPYESQEEKKIWATMDAIRGDAIMPCDPDAAINHVICVNGMQESMPEIIDFPKELVKKHEDVDGVFVDGLDDVIKKCFNTGKLPSEMNVEWSKPGKKIDLQNYRYFPSKV